MNILIPEKVVPVLAEADVVICGGGPAGIAAACSAARHGADVVLLERMPSLGGMATNALVNIWHTSDREKQVIFGMVQEAVDRGGRWVHRYPEYPTIPDTHWFEPEAMRIVFQKMLRESGVRVFCNLMSIETVREGNRLVAVLVDTKTGRKAVKGKLFIDATGDGDIAANAGLPFSFGRESDGLVQGCTMVFCLRNINASVAHATSPEKVDAVIAEMKRLNQEGRFPPFGAKVSQMNLQKVAHDHYPFNMNPVHGNPLDEATLTKMTEQGREQAFAYLEFWRNNMPGYEKAEVEQTAACLGVRETRRILGLKTLDRQMVVDAVKQPDAIGHGFWLVDVHDPKGSGQTTWEDQDARDCPPVGDSYHIPLGMCLNDTIENLAVAGRCASSTHDGHASVRIQTHCMILGQGIGTAAALALGQNQLIRNVSLPELQKTLVADGVYLKDVPKVKSPSEAAVAACI